MAGPSIAVRVIGDLSGLAKSMGDTAAQGEGAASRLRGAFTGALSAVNSTGVLGPLGDALGGIDTAIGNIIEHGKNIGPALMGAGAAVAGIGAGLSAFGSKEQASQQQLQQTIENTGKSYDDYSAQVEEAVKHQEHYGNTASDTQDALRILTQALGDPQKALDELGTASDLAAAKHEDLSTAAGQLGKAANGAGRILKEYGISQKDAAGNVKTHDEILKELSQKLSGQASAAADTFTGKLKSMKASVEDSVSSFAQKWGPTIQMVGLAMVGLGAAIDVAKVAQAAFNVVMDANPILLIVIAIAALVAGVILAYQHITWFHDAVQTAWEILQSGYDWIKTNWPLLLAILTGPFGLAVYFIVQNWQSILDFFKGIPGAIGGFFAGLVDILTAPFKWAWGVISGIAGDIAGAFGGVGSAISDAFKAAFNFVAEVWNNTVGSLSFTVPDWVPFLGGKGWSVPDIPTFGGGQPSMAGGGGSSLRMATGGIVTRPTMALIGEAGPEAVIPLNRMGTGPAVHIETANFTGEADIDLLLRRTAWAARTAGV